jgi:hypothetical protein
VRLSRAKAAAVGATVASVAVGAWAGSACIPDLQTMQLPPLATGPLCGNGLVDRDAGEACDPGEAGAVGCTSRCQIDCGDAGLVDPATNHCYFLPNEEQRDYSNASTDCFTATAHPVTFGSPRELEVVSAWAPTVLPGFWIGFVKSSDSAGYIADSTHDEPGWEATNCSGCYAATFDGGIPKSPAFDGGTSTACVIAPAVPKLGDKPWLEWTCDAVGTGPHTVCEREPPGASTSACNGAFCVDLAFTHATKRYLLFVQPATGDAAEAQCEQLDGGRLVTLQSPEEREELWNEIGNADPSVTQVWIGLAIDGDGGAWVWSDGTLVDSVYPNPWGDKQPADAGATRAYLQRLPNGDEVDNQLAQNFDHTQSGATAVPAALAFVCELPPGDGPAAP